MDLQEEVDKLQKDLEAAKKKKWDVPKEAPVDFFDPELSYELTGYKPIDKTHGLDFKPEWFTETRETYEKTGKYCAYLPGSKHFREFWKEQYKRCKYGMTVNGYTITGFHYFFLNFYTLPLVNKVKEAGQGRPEGFPLFTVAQYIWFHYLALCCKLLKNACLMKARGVGFSEINACMAAAEFTIVRQSTTIITCHDAGKLSKTLKKVWHALAFLDRETQGGMAKNKQIKNTDMEKTSGAFIMDHGTKIPSGWQSTVLGIVADDPQKIRGDRADFLIYDESGCHAPGTEVIMADGKLKKVEDIVVGDLVMGDDGTPRKVLELHHGFQQMYKIIPAAGDAQIVNANHVLYGKKRDYYRHTYEPFTIKTEDYYNIVTKHPRKKDGYKLLHSNAVNFPHQDVPIDPYIFGIWLGDGDSSKARFTSEDPEIIDYITKYGETNDFKVQITNCENAVKCRHIYLATKESRNQFVTWLRELGVFNNKHIPDCYLYNDKETLLQMLAGLIDSDGNYSPKKKVIEFSQYEGRKHLVDQVEFVCRSLGMRVSRDIRISKERILHGRVVKGGIKQYRLKILWGHNQIPSKLSRKRSVDRDNSLPKSYHDRLDSNFTIEKLDIGEYYGFSLDGNHLFLLKDFTVCHNSWPSLETAVTQGEALVEIGGTRFGVMIFGGR